MSNTNNFPCDPVDLQQPCTPCTAPTTCTSCEGTCTCTEPDYEEDNCISTQGTDCTTYSGSTNDCIPVTNGQLLTETLQSLITYVTTANARLISDSLVITTVDDDCDDKSTIELVPSTDPGNQLTLGTDGYPYVPAGGVGALLTEDTNSIDLTGDGLFGSELQADIVVDTTTNGGDNILTVTANGVYVPPTATPDPLCDQIENDITNNLGQGNGLDRVTYQFLVNGSMGCARIEPPLGFAVTGVNRTSAFGPLEFFESLTDANADAVSGETVIIFVDAPETLDPKDGVDYIGVGMPMVGDFYTTNAYTGYISNLKFAGNFTNRLSSNVQLSNVIVEGDATFSGTSKCNGGTFIGITPDFIINNEATVINAYIERSVDLVLSGKLIKSTIIDLDDVGEGSAIYMNCVSNDAISPTLTDCYVYSLNNIAVQTFLSSSTGTLLISNVTAVSDGDKGSYIHAGNPINGGTTIVTNLNSKSSADDGMLVVSAHPLASPVTSETNWLVSNCSAFSSVSSGISCINGNLKQCVGVSIAGEGIFIGGSDNNSANNNIIECIGESKGSNGLKCTRDVFVIGGTYISTYDDPAGNPISIEDANNRAGYYIAGVKTYAIDTTAYAINGVGTVTARISGCQFLNQFLLTNVPGINNVTLRAITTDAYGNIR